MLRTAVLKETAPGEARVAIIPDTVKRLSSKGFQLVVETGAGASAGFRDEDYRAAGATILPGAAEAMAGAGLVLRIQPPSAEEIAALPEGTALVSLVYALSSPARVRALAARKATVLAADSIPRTTLAQMMDVLSSQATIAGYRAVILAAGALPKLFPMLMTAAGTVSPARVLILGAGVAGLQAIATARRLGAVVEAFDVRKVVKEQVESLGAKFVAVESAEDAQTASGYAKEVSEEYKAKQAALLARHIAASDAVITTALIPGKRAPILITAAMVNAMRPGSVVVDLAAEQGGNCEATRPGETIRRNGVAIIGEVNLASHLAVHASQMYSRNMEKLLLHLVKDGVLKLDAADEITRGMLIVRAGDVVHPGAAEAVRKEAAS